MPTEKPRVTFTVSKETLDEIERYRFEKKSKNQSQAILSLIERGLESCEKEIKKAPSDLSEEAHQVAKDYDGLDRHGKNITKIVITEEQKRMVEERRKAETGEAGPKRTKIIPL